MKDFNIKNIINSLFKNIEKRLYLKKEYAYAVLTFLFIILVISAMNRATNKAVEQDMRFGKTEIEQNDSSQTGAETQSIRDVALQVGISADQLMGNLQKKGIKLNNVDDTIEQIAHDNRIFSAKLLDIMNTDPTASIGIRNKSIARTGGLTLEEVCDQKNLSLNEILAQFEMMGFRVEPKDKMRQIAKNLGISSNELNNIITGGTQ